MKGRIAYIAALVSIASAVSGLAAGPVGAKSHHSSHQTDPLPRPCDAGRAGGDLNVRVGETCSLVSNGNPTKQIRLDFPYGNYALIQNVGDSACAIFYSSAKFQLQPGHEYPNYNAGSTNSWGPAIGGQTCKMIFTGKKG